MTDLPVFATNRPRRGETVAEAVSTMLRQTREGLAEPPSVAIATAYLNAGGFSLLADELEHASRVRLLIGADPDAALDSSIHAVTETAEPHLAESLDSHTNWLAMQRNVLGFTRESSAAAKRLLEWLQSLAADDRPKVEVRRFGKGFLHGKCYISEHPLLSATLAGSSNLTYAGLSLNAELNLGTSGSPGHVAEVREWFDELWGASDPFDLAAVYGALWEPHSPWTVFLRMLYELYGAAPEPEVRRTELNLTGFGLDGVARMLRLLEQNGGVILADDVGLGKTYMAGEVIARAANRNRQRVLVIAPAALVNGMWRKFLKQYDFSRKVELMSYDELRLKSDPTRPGSAAFIRDLDDYALVVVDEAHNLRNPSAQRSAAVSALLGGSRPKQVILLTATPVNNSLMDLHTLVTYFIRNDAAFTHLGIPSVRGYIKHAMSLDPDSLSPEHLFDLMDQVAVRRTRKFVTKHYPHDSIRMPDGTRQPITFPTPKPVRVNYELDAAGDALVDAVVYALETPQRAPLLASYLHRKSDPKRLMLARYAPSAYRVDEELESHQIANVGLLQSALLKRLESSPAALRRTLNTLIASHEKFLAALERGYVMTTALLNEWSGSEDEELDEWVAQLDGDLSDQAQRANEFHAEALQEDAASDLALLRELYELADSACAGADPKAQTLIEELRSIAAEAARPDRHGLSSEDRRKTLVFSTFADTIEDLHRRVDAAVAAAPDDDPLSHYRGRVPPPIKGQKTGVDQDQRARILAGFAPRTAGELDDKGTPRSEDEFDLLFTTDVLSEGVNLQQAGKIVNYDLPWNPMRLVQRHGRIDRIGSKHNQVMLYCFFPAEGLEDFLQLEATLQRKIAYADAAVGIDTVLPGAEGRFDVIYGDSAEVIRGVAEENPDIFINGGTRSAAQSGEEYRRRLQDALANPVLAKSVKDLPWMAGSGFVSQDAPRSGYVFCLRIGPRATEQAGPLPDLKPWFRFVAADPVTWEPRRGHRVAGSQWQLAGPSDASSDTEPEVIVDSDTLTCLMTADPGDPGTVRELPDLAYERAFDAFEAARDSAYTDWIRLTDPIALMPEVPRALRDAAEFVAEKGSIALSPDAQNDLLLRLNTSPPNRVVREVRAVMNREGIRDVDRLKELGEVVEQAGLTPAEPGEPLPYIRPEDIHVVAWMAVLGRDAVAEDGNGGV